MVIERKTGFLVQFFIRGIVGLALIFFVNYYLGTKGVSAEVGLNPVTFATSGALGAPGVALLYAVTFFHGM